jgi:hypothetical protein
MVAVSIKEEEKDQNDDARYRDLMFARRFHHLIGIE